MTKSQIARTSACLNVLGSLLVFLSFQATSTRLLLVTSNDKSDKTAAFCIGDRAFFGISKDGSGTMMGYACPQSENMKPTVVANSDAPWMGKFGWFLLLLGFFGQVYSIEPSTLTNEQLRVLRKAQKILDSK
jgi:hypothetical protein